MDNSDLALKKGSRWRTFRNPKRSYQNANKPLFRLLTVIKIVFAIILISVSLLTGAVIYVRNFSYPQASDRQDPSNLGDSIIMAVAVYTKLGGTFGDSTSETVKEMQKGASYPSFTAVYARATYSVGVTNLKCSEAVGCQEVEFASIAPHGSACYYVTMVKTTGPASSSTNGANSRIFLTSYGSRLLKSGEATCSTSDKVSNWKVGGFPPT
ncbi:MAG: hypothetical protein HKL80_11695 [Acidimicrobiales bacterium]|nr:hypothetical protein [Acidimicrobiales bacterium]